MKALSVFRPRIAPRVLGCNTDLIDQAVLDSCIDFCERSLVVKRMADAFSTVVGIQEYDLDTGVVQVMRAWCDATEITPIEEDGMGVFGFVSSVPGQTNAAGTPRFFAQADPGVITLFPTPDKVYMVNMRVALKPSRSASSVDDQLFDDWVEVVVDGALMRLYAMPGEWASPTLHKYHLNQFENGINAAMLEARLGATRAETRVNPVRI